MFDHNRLSRSESILARAAMSVVAGLIGFTLMVGFLVGVADAMTDDKIQGTPTPVPPSVCDMVDWQEQDVDGRVFRPFDANQDGVIDCESDIETGR